MAYEAKTRELDQDVRAYLDDLTPASRREDGLKLLALFEEASGMAAKLWTGNILGFGKYQYRYASGHSGEAAIAGFAMRKAEISLYIYLDDAERQPFLARLGKHRAGVGCIYIKRVSNINTAVLSEMISLAVKRILELYPLEKNG